MTVADLFAHASADADAEMPSQPGLLLLQHVTWRAVLVGSVLGLGLGGVGIAKDYATTGGAAAAAKTADAPVRKLLRAGEAGVIMGAVLGTGLVISSAMRKPDMDLDGIEDRAFRLWNTPRHVRVDQYTASGAVLGALATLGSSSVPPRTAVFGGVAVGSTLGLLVYAVFAMER